MEQLICRKRLSFRKKQFAFTFILFSLSFLMLSCGDPRKVDVQLKETPPETKITTYTDALRDLGLMTEVYATGILKLQSSPIGDNTGTSISTGGEIQKDITEIIKSSLNSIGGNVVYIPYDPSFIQSQMVTGYSGFENKIIPDVVLTGGITEFDRGLVTTGESTDVSAGTEFGGLPDWLPSKDVSMRYGSQAKEGLARITLDFNLLDFKTMTGIARMNTVNTMEVHKAEAGKELGISLFGQTFGLKGKSKKVQGRHAAIRLLVELSMIQIAGKHLVIPYWRLLGEGALPDPVVLEAIKKYYYKLSDPERTAMAQEWLYLYGYAVPLNGTLNAATQNALREVNKNYNPANSNIDVDTFLAVYSNIPITQEALGRRGSLANAYAQAGVAAVEEVAQAAPQASQGQAQSSGTAEAQAAPSQPKKKTVTRSKIGRILGDEEW